MRSTKQPVVLKETLWRPPEFKDRRTSKKTGTKKNDYIPKTSRMVTQALDRVQHILQGDIEPNSKADAGALSEIRVNFIRAIRLAGEMGIDVELVWKNRAKPDIKNLNELKQVIDIKPQ